MWSLRRPTREQLDAELARVATLPPSYAETGMLRDLESEPPRGYGRTAFRAEFTADFDAAREAVATYATHRLPYLFVHPPDARVAAGADVVVCARIGFAWSVNPCRVLTVESSADRYAYVYATLPGHAEHGEEIFAVTRLPGGRVRAETVAFARPQDLLARLGKPVAEIVQRRAKRDYMQALQAAVAP